MQIKNIEDINEESLKELTPEELVDLKVTLEEMLEDIDNFLEELDLNNSSTEE